MVLKQSQAIWEKSKFSDDARFHQAALMVQSGRFKEAGTALWATKFSHRIALALRRHAEFFAPLETVSNFRADAERSLARGVWQPVISTEFSVMAEASELSETVRTTLGDMVDRYHRERTAGNEVRIIFAWDPRSSAAIDMTRFEELRQLLWLRADALGVDRCDWVDASVYPRASAGEAPNDRFHITMSVEQGPRRILE